LCAGPDLVARRLADLDCAQSLLVLLDLKLDALAPEKVVERERTLDTCPVEVVLAPIFGSDKARAL
jgi:hypothetical protein